MKFKLSIALVILGLPFSLLASGVLGDYKVSVGDKTVVGGASFVKVKLPKEKVDLYKKSLSKMSTELDKCTSAEGSMENPFLGKSIGYEVSPMNTGCHFVITAYDVTTYSCRLSAKDRKVLAKSFSERSKTDDAMSDFSELEKSFLFDNDYCDYYRN
tara:strand:+ start:273 stop:743 length:471 start_codon:yes stop_codon:yes gene_type:complete